MESIPPHLTALAGPEEFVFTGSGGSWPLYLQTLSMKNFDFLPTGFCARPEMAGPEYAPAIILLLRMFPDSGIPADINLGLLLSTAASRKHPWSLNNELVLKALQTDDAAVLKASGGEVEEFTCDFGPGVWVSEYLGDTAHYSGMVQITVAADSVTRFFCPGDGRIMKVSRDDRGHPVIVVTRP
jgi:hypothetical protein